MDAALPIVAAHAAATVTAGAIYFRHARLARPPIGVFNGRDVAIVLVAIVAIPYVYLALPLGAVAVLVCVAGIVVLHFTLEPLVPRSFAWLVAVGLIAADLGATLAFGGRSNVFLAVNNVVLAVLAMGVANLWVQSGMRVRHVAVLAAGLTVYDAVATLGLTLMTDLVERLSHVPLAPMAGWDLARGGLAIGLGDLLLATVFPLAMWKAYGRRAAAIAGVIAVGAIVALLVGLEARLLPNAVPAMVVLGPLMVLQVVAWRLLRGSERTTARYLSEEPLRRRRRTRPAAVHPPVVGLRPPTPLEGHERG